MNRQSSLFVRFMTWFSTLLYQVFGHISWNSPPWIKRLRQQPKLFFSIFIVTLVCAVGSYWYWNRLDPSLVTAQMIPPSITPKSETLIPEPLIIDFGIKTESGFSTTSAAPIAQIGKQIHKGIEMSPFMPGKWEWQGDSKLIFTPSQDWPAGEQYLITFAKNIFAPQVKMAAYRYKFATSPLKIEVADLQLYQDLKDPLLRKIVGTLEFNFPVDRNSLSQHTHLVLQTIKNDRLDLAAEHFPLKISYDTHQRTAYIESAPITLPAVPRFVNLIIDHGVNAVKGPSKTEESITQKLLLPDAASFLQIKNVNVGIERDKQDHPDQILYIETTVGVSNADLLQYLQAYVLPKDYPPLPFHPVRKDYSWSKPGEVTLEILKLATPIQIHPLPEEHPYSTLHRFILQVAVPSHLYIQIAKGMPSFGGFSLGQDYATVLQTPDYPQEIHFLHKGSLMALSGEKKFTVSVRNTPEVKFSINRVLENHVNHLVTQTYGDFQNPKFLSSFDAEAISQISSEFRPFNMSDPGDLQYTTIDLEPYLNKQQSSLGLFLLKAQAWDRKKNLPTGVENDRLILITDMNLLVKDNADDTHDFFVQSISQGTPLTGAQVSIMGKNGLPIISAKTDAQGHAKFPSVKDFKEDRAPILYLVRNGNDTSFIPYHRSDRILNYSRFNTGGINNPSENHLSAYLFSDREIYRPGENINIGVIVKNRFAHDPEPNLPLEAVITDSRGTIVLDQKVNLPSSHFFSLDYQLLPSSPTGQYHIHLYTVKDSKQDTLLGSNSVRVEEFLPDRLKMTAEIIASKTNGWISPLDLKAKISLWNLFGLPASNYRVTAKMIFAPQSLYFSKYSDYHFVDPLLDSNKPLKVFTENLTETHTDEKGGAEFNLNLERFAQSIYQLTVFAEGFEADSGRAVSAETSTLIAPLNFLVGYKSESDLAYLKQHSQHRVNFIAINPELTQIALNNLKLRLFEVKNVSTLIKKPDGTYQYKSVQQEIPIDEYPFEVDTQSSHFNLPTDSIGDFALMLSDENNNLLSKLRFSVVGESGNPVPKNAELNVKLDKKKYRPGDLIEMHITAPYTGAGLITIERENVHTFKWFQADATSSVQTIAIPEDFQGNGYINVAFVRSWDSDEIFINPLSYAIIPFAVSHEQQSLDVKLNVPKFIRAGEDLPIQFSTNKNGKIVVFAVDEGILQVANYQTPDPLAHFFSKQALTVSTSQIADLILPKYRESRPLSAPGGDGRLKLLAMNLNPFKRKNEKAVTFWSEIVESTPTPNTISFRVPDYFNGSLRVMAVAVAPEAVGSAETQTQVQAYFIINPNVPTFAAPGDTFTVTAAITNSPKNADEEEPIVVKLNGSPQLDILGTTEETVIIPPGQERLLSFQIRANENIGEAELTFTAIQGGKSSKRNATLSVRPASAYQSHIISGYDHASSKTISQAKQFYPEHRTLQATASTNCFILVNGLHSYLTSFPHHCTEQVISRAFAQLAMAKQPQEAVNQTLQILRERQTNSGGFCYWPGSENHSASEMATIYAMDYLTEAKMNGYLIPIDVFRAGIYHLQHFAKQDVSSLQEARMQAYAIYLLTRNGIITTNYLTNLQLYLTAKHKEKWDKDLISVYMAATYKLLQSTPEANRLIGNYRLRQNSPEQRSDFYNDLVSDAQYITLLARHFPEHMQKLGSGALVALAEGIASDQLNTLSAAYSIQALSAHAQAKPDAADSSLNISEILADNTEKTLTSSHETYQKVDFDSDAKQLRFHNPDKHTYFYQIYQAGFDKIPPKNPINNGLEIFREYRNQDGKAIESTELGNIIAVNIQARTLNNQAINQVAIVDLLPGGFEVVPYSIHSTCSDYIDVREDRIIFHCSLNPSASEFRYRLRAVSKGSYIVPPIFAQALYNLKSQAQGLSGEMMVK